MISIKKIKINADTLLSCLFLLYFCDKVFASVIARTLGSDAINISYILVFTFFMAFYLLLNNKLYNLMAPSIVFLIVFLMFLFTAFLHPEYESWFTHPIYGISSAILNPCSGIWAFLLVWLMEDEERLYKNLKLISWVGFIFYGLQFIAAKSRGYWIIYDVNDEIRQAAYSLEFGYDMLFPVAFMGSNAFLKEDKRLYLPYAIGVLMILFGGSRGAIIWPIVMFLLMIPFKWHNMNRPRRIRFSVLVLFLLIFALILFMNFDMLIMALEICFDKLGFSSRTLTSILMGTFSDDNGRGHIYSMALELIKTGGLFGWGVYGDRYVIGNYYRWGYSHNLFLEIFVSFGYLGGVLICFFLIVGVMKLYHVCSSTYRQVVFMTFLTTTLKLMLSNSFWYLDAFWALLALMLLWKSDKHKLKVK